MKWQVVVDGRPIAIDSEQLSSVRQVDAGVYSVVLDGASFEIFLSGPLYNLRAQVRGRSFAVEVRNPRDTSKASRTSIGSGRQQISAPMPGKVVRVLVNAGDSVEQGQGLIVVEAMKMQNEMKAAHPGRVVEIRAQAGDTVGAGDTLVILE
ncbi:MAG TPA: biotin/lipoyl-containing protein [Bryobacteraceae bacterium]|nr:biotin/lipoyl-containing protein [Bryobacteraceae bacterium]